MDTNYKKSNDDKMIAILAVLLFIILILLGGIYVYNNMIGNKNNKIEPKVSDEVYHIVYSDSGTPGSKSDITINGNEVKINTTSYCSTVDCEPTNEEKTYTYSNDNINKLKSFIDTNYSSKNIEINESELTKRQKSIIKGLLLSEYFFEINIEDYKYLIDYSRNDTTTYYIYLKNDESILVKKLTLNNYDITKVDTFSINFNKDNIKKIFDFVEKEKKENEDGIYLHSLKKDELPYVNSLIENNESYLNDLNIKLLYTISYKGINCLTPTLYLYNDNTYELYDTYGINGEEVTPKTGSYNYDMNKLINNIDKYTQSSAGPYSIIDENGKSYTTYNTNKELMDLEKTLSIKLETCLEQNKNTSN